MNRTDKTRHKHEDELPEATQTFRRRAWRAFQRALDPLAPPRPLPTRRAHR
jgi:hypothetical protein